MLVYDETITAREEESDDSDIVSVNIPKLSKSISNYENMSSAI